MAWAAGLWWSGFVLWSHGRPADAPGMLLNKWLENYLKALMVLFYLYIGISSWLWSEPLAPPWLALKAIGFGLIFLAAIMIDLRFKPVGPLLARLVAEGSSDATEVPLKAAMDRTRRWVIVIYLLLLGTAYLGTVKPL
jgi:hypothetical protein